MADAAPAKPKPTAKPHAYMLGPAADDHEEPVYEAVELPVQLQARLVHGLALYMGSP